MNLMLLHVYSRYRCKNPNKPNEDGSLIDCGGPEVVSHRIEWARVSAADPNIKHSQDHLNVQHINN